MGSGICFLITIHYVAVGTLLKCALKVPRGAVDENVVEWPMEEESRAALHALLPLHVRSCGPIVAVETIFEVAVVDAAPRGAAG